MTPRSSSLAVPVAAACLAASVAACGGSSTSPQPTQQPTASATSAAAPTATSTPHTRKASANQEKPGAAPYSPPPGSEPDPDRGSQYGLTQIDLPDAWNTSGGQGVVIAIVDTGVDLDHPDLKARLVKGHDFVEQGGDANDKNGHGTHVAGIAAAATDNGIGVAGGAPRAKIMPVRVLNSSGSGDPSTISKGIEWAAGHGAKVINLSLGESGFMGRLLKNGSLNPAISQATKRGAVVVAAAGNQGRDVKPYRVTTPVLVVSAVDQDGKRAKFSNFGASDAVSAPGVHILSTLPTYSTQITKEAGSTSYGYLDGTSMAAPYVSAEAALLMAQGRTPQDAMTAIEKTAKNPSKDASLGLGIVDAAAAVKSKGSSRSSSSGGGGSSRPIARSRRPARSRRG